MKERSQTPALQSLFCAIALAAVCLGSALTASGQVYPTTYGAFTSLPTGVATNDVVTVASSAVDVPQGRALAIVPEFKMAAAATGNVTFGAQVTVDGTNWTTSSGLTHTVAATGTNTVRSLWLLDPTELDAVRKLRISSLNNGANAVILTNLLITWSKAP